MAKMVDLTIAGRTYQVACREGEEDNLRAAARLVDGKSREALAGLGTLSEARQFLFASLLLADELVEDKPDAAAATKARASSEQAPAPQTRPDPALILRAEALADRLESLAMTLENGASNA
ncbi:cell division protein ZapA [Sphingomonas sp.]|uniref:cell division protein ZapA n=1 Tax=Sphingomonas sp. TaxID=28214 RepID=UPI0038B193FB